MTNDSSQNVNTVSVKTSSAEGKRHITFFMVVLVPVLAIGVAVVLTKKDIDINHMIFSGFKHRGDLLGESTVAVETAKDSMFSVFENNLKPLFSKPNILRVSSFGITADIVAVSVSTDGVIETPGNWLDVGWLKESGKPGENRNMVINGHFDDAAGAPAIFYKLKDIKEGTTIDIEDNYGRIFSYKVLKSTYVAIDDPDRLDILKDQQGKATLTLITCGGVWTPDAGYNKRLVVSAEYIGSKDSE